MRLSQELLTMRGSNYSVSSLESTESPQENFDPQIQLRERDSSHSFSNVRNGNGEVEKRDIDNGDNDIDNNDNGNIESHTPNDNGPNNTPNTPNSPDINVTPSRTSSKKTKAKEKRGLFARLSLVPEYNDAREYPNGFKYFIVFIVAFAAICGPMGTSIMLPAISDVVEELHTSVAIVNVSVGIYLLSLGIFPLWWSAFSEVHGRRSVYIISFIMFFGFSIGCSLSPNIHSLIIFRVFSGGCSASVQAVGAGTIGDLYPQHQRGAAMGWYYLGPLMGPFLAPILGGAVAQAWGWRATQWTMVIISGIAALLVIFGLPETLRKQDNLADIRRLLSEAVDNKNNEEDGDETPSHEDKESHPLEDLNRNHSNTSNSNLSQELLRQVTNKSFNSRPDIDPEGPGDGDPVMPSLSRLTTNRSNYSKRVTLESLHHEASKTFSHQASDKIQQSKWTRFKHSSYGFVIRPMHSTILLTYAPVALVICYSSVCFACIYLFNMSISILYSEDPYNFSIIIVGLLYIPNSVTYVIASLLGGRWNDWLLRRYSEKHNGDLVPEARLSWNIIVAVTLFPIACIIFGWTLDYGLHWVIPLIGTALFGFASMLVIGATVTYLVDTLPGKGATGVALNNLVRMILATIITFIVDPLLRALGPGILFSIAAGIVTVASVLVIYLKRKGDKLREKYDLNDYYSKL